METIKKIFKAIWAFINSKFLGYAIAIILVIWIASMCSRLRNLNQDLDNANQNNSALVDEVKKEKLKSGELQFSIDGYIGDLKALRKFNEDLAKEVDKQKGKVISLNRIVILLRQDTTDLRKYIDSLKLLLEEPIKINDTTYLIPWTLPYTYDSTNYDIFKGQTKIGLTMAKNKLYTKGLILTEDGTYKLPPIDFSRITVTHEGSEMLSRVTQIELTWGQKWEKGKLRIFANSKYPGFNVTNLEGVLLDVPKRSHWFTGFSVNIGIMPTYDFIQGKPTIVVGPCIGYTIYQW
jgi:hypothetical protein